jgi:carboxyl-terminal processing protease
MVISVHFDSPARSAGMLPGDYIVGVGGKSIDELGYDRMVDHIRGKIGTDVTVTVKREEKELSFTMTRAAIENRTVSHSISEDGIGYIRISGFEESTTAQFKEAVDAIENAGAVGVVFDLRSNPGGLVRVVSAMLSYLLPTGKAIVSYDYKSGPHIEVKALADGKDEQTGEDVDHVLNLPMAVVCNEYTASAAEIFTSVIRDHRDTGLLNAKIVGKTTYKKGIMQSSIDYIDGSLVTVTVAYYNPPSGINYHGIGITPDVEVSLPELKDGETTVEDTQLAAAIEELKKLINAN